MGPLFAHGHLRAVPCLSCLQPGLEGELRGHMSSEPIEYLVPRVNISPCDGRMSIPCRYECVNVALETGLKPKLATCSSREAQNVKMISISRAVVWYVC